MNLHLFTFHWSLSSLKPSEGFTGAHTKRVPLKPSEDFTGAHTKRVPLKPLEGFTGTRIKRVPLKLSEGFTGTCTKRVPLRFSSVFHWSIFYGVQLEFVYNRVLSGFNWSVLQCSIGACFYGVQLSLFITGFRYTNLATVRHLSAVPNWHMGRYVFIFLHTKQGCAKLCQWQNNWF